ncbi:MAG: type II toxin-antitoxin system RelE/ParE family toxin [Burkholderiaceae bacterium]
MTFRVRFTREAEDDLVRLYEFILDRDATDWRLAERALEAIRHAIGGLERSPFSYRKAVGGNPFLRELVIPFGSAGDVALFEIEGCDVVTILAVRHQREDDYF